MTIQINGMDITGVYAGTKPAKVYVGSKRVFPIWLINDDFSGSRLGPAWTGSGVVIENGALKKDSSNGSAEVWSVESLESDYIVAVCKIGEVTDRNQTATFMVGSASSYLYFNFYKNGWEIGTVYGSSRNKLSSGSATFASGDRLEFMRDASGFKARKNGAQIATVTDGLPTSAGSRRIGLSVARDSNIFGTYYGPTFDSVLAKELSTI